MQLGCAQTGSSLHLLGQSGVAGRWGLADPTLVCNTEEANAEPGRHKV